MANTKIIDVGTPQRGDVMVFRYPMDESMDYIKRVVGLPGDTVTYVNKEIRINGERVPQTLVGDWALSACRKRLPLFQQWLYLQGAGKSVFRAR